MASAKCQLRCWQDGYLKNSCHGFDGRVFPTNLKLDFTLLARLLFFIKKGGLLQLKKFGVVGVSVGVNIYLWAL